MNAKGRKPDYVGEINVTELALGEEFPILSNCRIGPVHKPQKDGHDLRPPSAGGGGGGESASSTGDPFAGPRLQARMDVDLSDFMTLGIETTLHLNYPYPLTATLPISIAVSLVRFSGTLSISFLPSSQTPQFSTDHPETSSSSPTPQTLAFSLQPDYRLDIHTTSQIGSRSRLQDMPKIGQLVDASLRSWIGERLVEPRVQQIVIPALWPRKGNVRMSAGAASNSNSGNVNIGMENQGHGQLNADARPDLGPGVRAPSSASDYKPGTNADHDGFTDRLPLGTENIDSRTFSSASGMNTSGSGDAQAQGNLFEEGLRARRRQYEMPGSMPGTMVN